MFDRNGASTARRIAELPGRSEELVTGYLAGMHGPDSFDVVSDLLSIDDDHRHLVRKWTEDLAVAAAIEVRGTAQAHARLFTLVKEVADYFLPLIEVRREHPTGDLISTIVAGDQDDALCATETVMFIVMLIIAGSGSTANMIGDTVPALMRHRHQLDLLVTRQS